MNKEDKLKVNKRNIPLIIMGIVVLLIATLLKASSIGLLLSVMLDVLQIIGVILILLGFGVPWTKKSRSER